jgi:hypothetical protein
MELAVEAPREVELLVVGEGLVAEHEHRELVHPRLDLGERLRIVHPAEIDRAHLGDEARVELREAQGHGVRASRPPRRRRPAGSPRP